MIRQICPSCFRSVELPDAAAGTDAPCPACGKPFAVPGTYAFAVDPTAGPPPDSVPAFPQKPARPAPPPGFVPPTAAGAPKPMAPPPESVVLTSVERTAGFPLSPTVLGWIPAACLTLVFLLTFFTWVGVYPGGYRAYTQNAWEAAFGSIDSNNFAEEFLKLETDLAKRAPWNLLLLPFLLGLLAVLALAWGERAVRDPDRIPVPAVKPLWQYRFALIAGLAALLFGLVAFQNRIGFGLETAVRQLTAEKYAEEQKAADNSAAKQKVAVKEGREVGSYQIQTTSWLALAVAALFVGVVAAGVKFWLDVRGPKPPPRIAVTW